MEINVNEIEATRTVLIGQIILEYEYEICLWKYVEESIGSGKRNVYRIRNSPDLKAGKLYWFHWLTDSNCLMSEESP